jgi:hypothetical protein
MNTLHEKMINERQHIKDSITSFYIKRNADVFLETMTDIIEDYKKDIKEKDKLINDLRELINITLAQTKLKFKLSERQGFWQCIDCGVYVYPSLNNINKHIKECVKK